MRIAALALVLALPTVAAPAVAFADACETIRAALERLAAAPAVAQSVTMGDAPPMRMVALGDAMYVDDGSGTWSQLPLEPGQRATMLAASLPDASALKDCAAAGSEAVDGVATTAYTYIPPSFAGEEPSEQKLWIGDADGLPYRMTTTSAGQPMAMTIRYEGVEAPM